MRHGVQFDPEARLEFLAAIDWYERKEKGLGAEFLEEVTSALDRISLNPGLFASFTLSVRRCVLIRFPYCVIYRQFNSVVRVLAVAHTSRRPGFWKKRF